MHLSKFKALLDLGLRVGDVLCIVAAAHIAYVTRFHALGMENAYIGAQAMVIVAALAVFTALKLYQQPVGERLATHFCCVAISWAMTFVLVIALGYMLKIADTFSRGWVSMFFFTGLGLMVALRIAAFITLRNMYSRGVGLSRCLLVGATQPGLRLLDSSRKDPSLGLHIAGYVRTPFDQAHPVGLRQVGTLDSIDAALDAEDWDQVLIALPVKATKAISHLMDRTEERVITVKFVPDTLGRQLINHRIEDVAGTPVMTLRDSPLMGQAWFWKNVEDRLIAGIILLMISPILAALAIGVKLTSPGPILYRQRRVGLDGEEFEMLKFRSMPVDVEKSSKVQWGNAGNKTNTRFGRFIRQTSLDELPQFINVLRGDMSIVGPRPERTVFVEKFKREIPGYMHKHLVKAGITGWAQINGWRGDTDLVKRIEYDLYYVNHWSVWFDLKIIFMTLFKGFVHSEKKAAPAAAGSSNVTPLPTSAPSSATPSNVRGRRTGTTNEELI